MSEKELLGVAVSISALSEPLIMDEILHPNWDSACPKWKCYVPCTLRDKWDGMSIELRLAVFATAYIGWDRSQR